MSANRARAILLEAVDSLFESDDLDADEYARIRAQIEALQTASSVSPLAPGATLDDLF